jgi:hypothetical protein
VERYNTGYRLATSYYLEDIKPDRNSKECVNDAGEHARRRADHCPRPERQLAVSAQAVKHRMPGFICECGHPLDGASRVGEGGDDPPGEGDLSICLYCGRLRAYGQDLKLRDLTEAELDDVMRNAEFQNMLANLRAVIRRSASGK